MFNIFEEEGEGLSDQAKVRMLFKKVEHPLLKSAIDALRVQNNMKKDGLTFTECANHLSAHVSELPDLDSTRKISSTNRNTSEIKRPRGGGSSGGGGNGNKRKGIHMPDGSVWSGYYSDWEKLSKEDKLLHESLKISWKLRIQIHYVGFVGINP